MAKRIEFQTEAETYAVYRLENGAVIRIKPALMNIVDNGKIGPNGLPAYDLNLQWMTDLDFTDALEQGTVVKQEPTKKDA